MFDARGAGFVVFQGCLLVPGNLGQTAQQMVSLVGQPGHVSVVGNLKSGHAEMLGLFISL